MEKHKAARYYLSMCCCPSPVRVRKAGQKPDLCEVCGGWLPDVPMSEEEWERERNGLVWRFMVGAVVATIVAVAAAYFGGGR